MVLSRHLLSIRSLVPCRNMGNLRFIQSILNQLYIGLPVTDGW